MNKKIIVFLLLVLTLLIFWGYASFFSNSPFTQSWALIVRYILTYVAFITPIILVLWLTIQRSDSIWQRAAGWVVIGILTISGLVGYSWRGNALVDECVSQGGKLIRAQKLTSFKFKCVEVATNKIVPIKN